MHLIIYQGISVPNSCPRTLVHTYTQATWKKMVKMQVFIKINAVTIKLDTQGQCLYP